MPRDGDEASKRLRHAAIELFARHGFDQTTAAQIAAHAGVTERTFFRHFPDKREVLFDKQDTVGRALAEAIRTAPPELGPMEALQHAFQRATTIFEANRPFSEPRQRIIAATPALQEREVAKHAALVRTAAEALQQRGVERARAQLAAQIALAALSYALSRWFADSPTGLADHIDAAFTELRQL